MTGINTISLQLEKVQLGYTREKPVFNDLSLSVSEGSFVGLIGNNGIGKSTLLKTLCGVIRPLSGNVIIKEKRIDDFTQEDLAKTVSVVLTEKVEGFNLRVYDVVAMGRYPYTGYFGELKESDRQLVEKYLELCGIAHVKQKSISEVSDGERQKAMIAKALAQQTSVILLDEPTAFLDYASKNQVTRLLKDLAHKENKIIVVSSHDLEMLMRNVDFCLLLAQDSRYIYDKPEKLIGTDEMKLLTGDNNFKL
ncbi:MAG: ABC transporter ATP-binding protein [Bacteroidia bacterium]